MSDFDPNDDGTRVCPDTGEEFTVVWSGGPLLGPRDTKIIDPMWTAPNRLYNKKPKAESPPAPEFDDQATDIESEFIVEEVE